MDNLSAEAWQRIEPILDEVLDRAPAERTAFLDRACAAPGGRAPPGSHA